MDPNDPRATKGILVEVLSRPSTTATEEVMIIEVLDWRSPIIEYLKSPTREIKPKLTKLRI